MDYPDLTTNVAHLQAISPRCQAPRARADQTSMARHNIEGFNVLCPQPTDTRARGARCSSSGAPLQSWRVGLFGTHSRVRSSVLSIPTRAAELKLALRLAESIVPAAQGLSAASWSRVLRSQVRRLLFRARQAPAHSFAGDIWLGYEATQGPISPRWLDRFARNSEDAAKIAQRFASDDDSNPIASSAITRQPRPLVAAALCQMGRSP